MRGPPKAVRATANWTAMEGASHGPHQLLAQPEDAAACTAVRGRGQNTARPCSYLGSYLLDVFHLRDPRIEQDLCEPAMQEAGLEAGHAGL